MAEMAKMSKMIEMTARDVIIGSVGENAEMSKMPKMFVMTARYVIHSLGGPAV
jgi:hypothetical protein